MNIQGIKRVKVDTIHVSAILIDVPEVMTC